MPEKDDAAGEEHRSTLVTVIVMVCTLISRILGFVKIAVIGAVFGASGTADVVNAVFQIPNNLRKLVAEGAFSASFIPVLSNSIMKEPFAETKKIARNILTFILMINIPLVLLAVVFARPVIDTLLPFPDPQKVNMAADLFRYIFPYILLVSLSAFLMGVLNSHNRFIASALAPITFSISLVFCVLVFGKSLGVYAMALGVLLGGLFQVAFQVPSYLKSRYDFKLDFKLNNPHFKTIGKQWLPILISSSIFALNQQLAAFFASALEDGSISALNYAIVFFQLPFGIFSVSITTVLFPRMSRQAATDDRNGLRETLSYGLSFMLVLLIPAAIGFIFMGKEIIAVALERAKFTRTGTEMTYQVLVGYSYGLFCVGAYTYLQRFFYSIKEYWTPLFISIGVIIIDIIFSIILKETALRVSGLAYANSISYTAGLIAMIVIARKKLKRINGKYLAKTLVKTMAAMAVMAGFIIVARYLTGGMWTEKNSLVNLLLVAAICVLAAGIAFGMYYVTRTKVVLDLIHGRFKRK
ncbi:MAG: murein biosynthesis integral membrane protein MurJ [Spirochaetales bacterium]|nr:murein biosynthesis integral membrane protein MurJ [Spirochaetales bacterium]